MTGYIGIGGTAKKVKNIYVGVGGVAKKVKKGYIGVGGVAKLWYNSLPTLKEIFFTTARAGANGGVAFTNTQSITVDAGTWYSIFTRGGALCIAKTVVVLDAYGRYCEVGDFENLVSIAADGVSPISATADIYQQYVMIENASMGRGCHFIFSFNDTYSDEIISYVLQNAPKECLRYYNSSSASPSSGSGVEYSASEAAGKKGYLWAAWPENTTAANPYLSLSKCSTPSESIFSCVSGSYSWGQSNTLMVSGGNIYPTNDGSEIARTRCYSLFRFEDVTV